MNISIPDSKSLKIPLEECEDCPEEDTVENTPSLLESMTTMLGIDLSGEIQSIAPKASVSKEIQEFALPITYLDPSKVFSLKESVSADLELVGAEFRPGMYDYFFQPSHSFSKELLPSWQKQYTTDTDFLSDSQTILSNMSQYKKNMENMESIDTEKITEIWALIKKDDFFLEKYGFLEWDWVIAKQMNQSSTFLQFMSIMNILSPAMSLLMPFFLLLFPFLLLKIQSIPISFETYVETLKSIAKHHFIGKTLMGFDSLSWDKVIYFIFMMVLYGLQIYQNTNACFRFYRNMKKVNDTLVDMKHYCKYSIESMENYCELIQECPSYKFFEKELRKHIDHLRIMHAEIQQVTSFSHSADKVLEFGYMLKCFYELHKNKEYESGWRFSMGFEGYMDHLKGLHSNWKAGNVATASFAADSTEADTDVEETDKDEEGEEKSDAEYKEGSNSKKSSRSSGSRSSGSRSSSSQSSSSQSSVESIHLKKSDSLILKGQYYPALIGQSPVKNDCRFGKNMILSAPNKAGKTTILKTTAINLLFTQQTGLGFYESATLLTPYTHFHSYLNIPDTSGRDSLFQAESRRCKEILDSVKENTDAQKYKHFCIFDELYSGTNPEEACKAGCAFLKYLCRFSTVDFMLTTHYNDICKRFKNSTTVQNYKMEVIIQEDGAFDYTYRMLPGISKIKGAIRVLKDMDYPSEILEEISGK